MTDGKTLHDKVNDARVGGVRMLTPDEASALLERGSVTVIDVGEEWQLRERGTLPGARNISRGELEIKADTREERRDPALQDRNQKILLTCGGGGKATLSAAALQEMGFTDVSVLEGGCRGWQKAGYALEPYPGPDTATTARDTGK
ncbi:rhodanese-like domain-containing protein [Bradyrhizobium sp. CB1650]|uniref:rhodanese-like domain-containing protein n=1 Tax=Bradyrhizobium sp. CB1650 TaxID=3039153 RepID=UPI002435ED51|nr:rhodanese-like domain-containing protein [Bradyrhizobium sp. CB1650]WGD48536.1 rhodanese-like domain-containing protein [Bradyrhizobium sp. CB1650]